MVRPSPPPPPAAEVVLGAAAGAVESRRRTDAEWHTAASPGVTHSPWWGGREVTGGRRSSICKYGRAPYIARLSSPTNQPRHTSHLTMQGDPERQSPHTHSTHLPLLGCTLTRGGGPLLRGAAGRRSPGPRRAAGGSAATGPLRASALGRHRSRCHHCQASPAYPGPGTLPETCTESGSSFLSSEPSCDNISAWAVGSTRAVMRRA